MELHFSVGSRRKTLKNSMRMFQNVAIYGLLTEKQNLKSSLRVPIGSSLQLMMEQLDAEELYFLDWFQTNNVIAVIQPQETSVRFLEFGISIYFPIIFTSLKLS